MKNKIVCVALSVLLVVLLYIGYSLGDSDTTSDAESVIVDMGNIGNKILIPDGIEVVAYVAGENKVLVPTSYFGSFEECVDAVPTHIYPGCENPRLPSGETNDLPEEVVREIISDMKAPYEDSVMFSFDGFWTDLEAKHSTMEIVGMESMSNHYAGVLGNFFRAGADGVAEPEYGYFLKAYSDSTRMGLLVLLDVIPDKFEFEDIEDTADPNYDTEPRYDDIADGDSIDANE